VKKWWPRSGRKDGGPVGSYEVQYSDDEWRERLGPQRYAVLRRSATEPPWSGDLLEVHEDGMFRCAGCGAELYSSANKFESGTGWPSFDRAVADGREHEHVDRSLFMVRTEITCGRCGGHLGHVFDDGPTETGQRFCVNSLSLEFEPATEQVAEPVETAEA
jgi:methionine-R-sulfoxide reductase